MRRQPDTLRVLLSKASPAGSSLAGCEALHGPGYPPPAEGARVQYYSVGWDSQYAVGAGAHGRAAFPAVLPATGQFQHRRRRKSKVRRACAHSDWAGVERNKRHYLQNINSHDKWLKMAIVARVLGTACHAHEAQRYARTEDVSRFERFELFTLVLASIYLDRVVEGARLRFREFVCLFLVCNIIACKLQEDYSTLNGSYAGAWGVPVRTLNALEVRVLDIIGYNVAVGYQDVVGVIEERIAYLNSLHLK